LSHIRDEVRPTLSLLMDHLGVGSPKQARAGRRRRYIADGFFIMDDESRDIECGFVIPVSRAAGEV
jgi:hypothetical protein